MATEESEIFKGMEGQKYAIFIKTPKNTILAERVSRLKPVFDNETSDTMSQKIALIKSSHNIT